MLLKCIKREPKGAKREPKGSQRRAKRDPEGANREPKGSQREPKGVKREPKGNHCIDYGGVEPHPGVFHAIHGCSSFAAMHHF